MILIFSRNEEILLKIKDKSQGEFLKEKIDKIYSDLISVPYNIKFNLKKPFPNCLLSINVEVPEETLPGSIVKIQLTMKYHGEFDAGYLITFDDLGALDEEIVTFVEKTRFLVNFTESENLKEVEIEAFALRTGYFRLPDIKVIDFKCNSIIIL